MKDKQFPMPFVVPGASAISHAVPAGEWGLNGRMALRHQGGEDYLLGAGRFDEGRAAALR